MLIIFIITSLIICLLHVYILHQRKHINLISVLKESVDELTNETSATIDTIEEEINVKQTEEAEKLCVDIIKPNVYNVINTNMLNQSSLIRKCDEYAIMAIDDESIYLQSLENIFAMKDEEGYGYNLITYSDPRKALEELKHNQGLYDLLLLDFQLNNTDGYEIVKEIREIDNDIPIIFLTAQIKDPKEMTNNNKVSVLELIVNLNVQGIISKLEPNEFILAKIYTALRYVDRMNIIKTQSYKLIEQTTLAATDVLTGLYNRRYLMEYMMVKLLRNDNVFSVVMFDIDHFKYINDTYGHDAGDSVLKQLSKMLKDFTRNDDILARYGGEEFILLLNSAVLNNAKEVAERIRQAVEKTKITIHDDVELSCTISVGVAEYDLNEDINSLIKRVDIKLYEAKKDGRNNVKW